MAGNLMSTPAGFTSIAVGSGTTSGSAYSGGSEILGVYTGTFTSSKMTCTGSGGAITLAVTVGGGLAATDYFSAHLTSANTAGFSYEARITSAGVATLTAINSNVTAATQDSATWRWVGMKVAP